MEAGKSKAKHDAWRAWLAGIWIAATTGAYAWIVVAHAELFQRALRAVGW